MLKPFYNKKKNIDNRLLPVVSAADAGKVLGVDEDGKIVPVEGGGGGDSEKFLIHMTYNDDAASADAVTITESISDINAAILAGKIIMIRFVGSGVEYDYDGYLIPPAYYTEAIPNDLVASTYITIFDPINLRGRVLYYSMITGKWAY